ncbi:MAG: DUF92 domain-containing protein [Pseudomonadales bacterium]
MLNAAHTKYSVLTASINYGIGVTTSILASIVASVVVATVAYWQRFLTLPAAIAAATLGGIILFFGGWDWGVATAGSFFITALLSQRHERIAHRARSSENAGRNLQQVLANGLVLALLAGVYHSSGENYVGVAAFLGCVGAVAGDTWATTTEQFSATDPRLLTTGQCVPHGTPGAVSGIGMALTAIAGLVACALYLFVAMIIHGETTAGPVMVTLTIAAIVGAVAGSLFDSYLGAAWQALYKETDGRLTDHPVADNGSTNSYVRGWRWLSNDLVNFSNSVVGAVSAYFVWFAAGLLGVI